MNTTSETRNNEIVAVNLSIGQCKTIGRLLDAELSSAEAGTSDFSENALKALIDVFFAKTQAAPAEKQAHLANWVASLHLKGLHHG
jgi:hypothetical protein